MLPWLVVAASFFAAALLPFVFVVTRESTKQHRQGIVEDLKLVFDAPGDATSTIIPSFEFVKYKYSVPTKNGQPEERRRQDFTQRHWVLSAIPLVLSCFVLNAVSIGIVLHTAFRQPAAAVLPWLRADELLPLSAWVLLAAYTGAMLFTLRSFRQAINNFDLSPFSLLGGFVNICFAVLSAPLLIFGVFRLLGAIGIPLGIEGPAAFPVVLIGAFTAGYFPDVAVRTILRWSRLRFYKRENTSLFEAFKSTPLEVIDGIDSEIRSRLEDYHIVTVQNLAAANPLMLFVETPYGVYQIMDWVAQAQLCASVGPAALQRLWKLGIRTIFDLERVLLDPVCQNERLVASVGAILWEGPYVVPAGQTGPPDVAAVKANIRFRLENPHVHRLRQIFNQVSLSLGDEARRLWPDSDGPRCSRPFDDMRRTATV